MPSAQASPWTALHFPTGPSFNHTLAVGDLDRDGKLDVATPNSQASAVTVLLGNGDGTLEPFHAWPTFAEPQDVQMADLDGDGVLDLATPDYSAGVVTVLRGLGDGTFAPREGHAVGTGLVSLAAADLNGDGRLDLAVSRESNSRIAVLTALAEGGFATAVQFVTGTAPHQIATADFDHDGHPDLVVANVGAGTISVHLGDGTSLSPATPFAAGPAPLGLTITDLNLDGDADLVVSNVNSARVSVLLGNGDGTFDPPVGYPTDPRPRGMDAGDLDGDGVPDLVIATGYPDGDSLLTIYRGTGDGTLSRVDHFELPYRAADCVIADMNGDGHRDIVTTGPWAGVVSVLLNPGPSAGVPAPRREARMLELDVRPNPAPGPVTLRFRSREAGEARLEILDLAGRRIATFGPFAPCPDARFVTWHPAGPSAKFSGPGLYMARLIATDGMIGRRFVLLAR